MRNKKGFTLVELVIVIAVIAILAGVMIAVFANVVQDARESAELQELRSQEIAQKADDIIKKVDDANWLGWEDFETNLVARMTEAYKTELKYGATVPVDAIQDAVRGAVAKYYAENLNENTGLTEAQVKAIVENALKGGYSGVTEAQVRAIVNSAVSGTSTLTRAQVQTIVDSASSKNLTAAQVSALVTDAVRGLATSATVTSQAEAILEKIESATANLSKLTEDQVEAIVNAAVWNAGGVTKTWFDDTTYDTTDTFTLGTSNETTIEQEVAGLATLVNGGYDFENKTIVLNTKTDAAVKVNLPKENWTPIGNTRGNEFKGTIDGGTKGTVIDGLTLDEQFSAVKNGYLIDCASTGNMDKVGVGFVAALAEGATLKNITFTNVNVKITEPLMDGISVGVAVGYLCGGTIENVKVLSGSISSVYYTSGLVGAGYDGVIKDCQIGTDATTRLTITTTGVNGVKSETGKSHYQAAGLIGYLRCFETATPAKANIEITNTKVFATISAKTNEGVESYAGNIVGKAGRDATAWNVKINGEFVFGSDYTGKDFTTTGVTVG